MTKTICDVCGKQMPTTLYPADIEDRHFCISSMGRPWDICDECLEEIGNLLKKRHLETKKS
jgi:hypothetical protein